MGDIVCTCPSGFVAAYGFHNMDCPMHYEESCEYCQQYFRNIKPEDVARIKEAIMRDPMSKIQAEEMLEQFRTEYPALYETFDSKAADDSGNN